MMVFAAVSAGALAMMVQSASAADSQPHPLVDAALSCRAQTDDQARLRCYDAAVAAMQQGLASGSLVAVEREEAQRSLFGLSLPRFLRGGGGGGDGDNDDVVREIQTTVRSASHSGYQRWVIDLEEGGTWQTIENSSRQELPRSGQRVKITRAGLLGNYWMSVDGAPRLRVSRVR